MFNTPDSGGSGSRLGIARGEIRIDVSNVERGAVVITQQSRQMTVAFNQMGQSAEQNARRAGSAFQQLGNAVKGLGEKMSGALGVLAGGAFVAGGLRAAQSVQRLNALMLVFSGTQERANERMTELRQIAEDTGQSFLQVAEAASAILPAVSRNNVNMRQMLSVVQRLALLDPAQGIEGASYAVRELLSGTYTSLSARFEMSRAALKDIVDQAGGDPQKIIEGLSMMVDQMGLTDEAFQQMNESGINAFSRLRGELTEAIATGFTPFLQNIALPMATAFGDWVENLNRTNPAILQLVATVGILAAAIGPANRLITGMVGGVRQLVELARNPIALKVAVTGAAVAAGTGIGLSLVEGLANAGVQGGDFDRIRAGESAADVVGERFKQVLVIVVDTLIRFAEGIANVGAHIIRGFELVGAALQFGVNTILAAFYSLRDAIEALNPGNERAMAERGRATMGEEGVGQAAGVIVEQFGEDVEGFRTFIRGLSDAARAGINFFANELPQNLQDVLVQEGFNRANFATGSGKSADQQRAEDAAASSLDFLRQGFAGAEGEIGTFFTDLRTGVVQSLSESLGLIEPAAEDAAGALSETANAVSPLKALYDEVAAGTKALRDTFAQESVAIKADRTRQDSREETAFLHSRTQTLMDFHRQQAEMEVEFYARRAKAFDNLQQELSEAESQAQKARMEAVSNFNQESQRRAQDHQLRLLEIEQQGRRRVTEAAARLDAVGVENALSSMQEQTQKEVANYNLEAQRRNEDYQKQLDDLAKSFRAHRAARIAAFNQQQTDEFTQYMTQRTRRVDEFNRQIAEEDYQRKVRAAYRQQDRALEDAERAAALQAKIVALNKEKGLNQAFVDTATGMMGQVRSVIVGSIAGVLTSIGAAVGALTGSNPTSAKKKDGGGSALFYGSGGIPPVGRDVIVGEGGPELARFLDPVRIYSNQQSRSMLAAGTASGGAGGGLSVGNLSLSFSFGDIGGYSKEDLRTMMKDTATEALADAFDRLSGRSTVGGIQA